ncbi:MAG: DUF429 domain-containing protein [Acidimicrobiales bacterium]|nr:DUF429 domain-containing protein [Acidimicrobiales bacterium]
MEAYPVAALRLWGIPTDGYRSPQNVQIREDLLDAMAAEGLPLNLGRWRTTLMASSDGIDALTCALVARLASRPDRVTGQPQQACRSTSTW